ncbi:MAG: HAMP domain-containing sensor histidine kinase [Pseudomonadota bacterium]
MANSGPNDGEIPETKEAVPPDARWWNSLSSRLFLLTIGAILFVEVLIFIPSAANFRATWLKERVQAAQIAALAIEAAPSRAVSMELSSALLKNAEVLAVAEMADGVRYRLLPAQIPIKRPIAEIDLRDEAMGFSITETIGTLFVGEERTLMVITEGMEAGSALEILVLEGPLREELWGYARNILWLSLFISVTTGAVIYAILLNTVVRPVRRVTTSVEQFRKDPGAWTRRLQPTKRQDEIGRAQNALSDMEAAVSESFRQRQRLAELGEAVARINHDLRGSLAAAQLVSDSLSRSDDPRVKRAAPRLERALERAIRLATDTLQYGKAKPTDIATASAAVKPIISEAADEALARYPDILWKNTVPDHLEADIDTEALHRILANLIRNAAEAMGGTGTISVCPSADALHIRDTGPGLPEALQEDLFKPFAVTTKRKGTGLGLAIAKDLAFSMGGSLDLLETGPNGTVFALRLKGFVVDTADDAD